MNWYRSVIEMERGQLGLQKMQTSDRAKHGRNIEISQIWTVQANTSYRKNILSKIDSKDPRKMAIQEKPRGTLWGISARI